MSVGALLQCHVTCNVSKEEALAIRGAIPSRDWLVGGGTHPLTLYCTVLIKQVPPRLELGLLDSESRVLTITPWNLHVA